MLLVLANLNDEHTCSDLIVRDRWQWSFISFQIPVQPSLLKNEYSEAGDVEEG